MSTYIASAVGAPPPRPRFAARARTPPRATSARRVGGGVVIRIRAFARRAAARDATTARARVEAKE
jgi:hypothetical protein